jgi:Flp pilus assembly protein TadG
MMMKSLRRGQSLVEFALIGSLLIVMLLGTVDFARASYNQVIIRGAVAEGAYVMAQNPSNRAAAEERIWLELETLDDVTARTTITWTPDPWSPRQCNDGERDTTTLEVAYRHQFWFASVLPQPEITLRSSSTVPQFGGCS